MGFAEWGTTPAVRGEMSIHDICVSRLNREETPASSSGWWGWQPRSPPATSLHNPTSHLENDRWKCFCFHPFSCFCSESGP